MKLTRLRVLLVAAFASFVTACGNDDNSAAFTPAPEGTFLPPTPPAGFTAKSISYANRDMVSAANPLAVDAGVAILAEGGSAVDAAIAVQMVLNLVEPQSSGIGGGAFLIHHDAAAQKTLAYDGRETAPAAATGDLFIRNGTPLGFAAAVDGGLSVGTPGLVRMLEDAHKAHGKLPWARLFAAAIKLSDDGFAISPRLSASIAGSAARIKAQGEPINSYFLNADGTAKAAGTLLKNPDFAATLRTLSTGGAAAFYGGPIAQDMVNKVKTHPTNPGRLELSDLAGYQAKVRAPLCGDYRTLYVVCGMPPPSSGAIAVLQTLGILNNFNLSQFAPNSVDHIHLVSEAYRLAYADRARYVADSDFVNVPVGGLVDPVYLRNRSAIINMDRSMGVPVAGIPAGAPSMGGLDASADLPATSHMAIIDKDGNAVSMTTTIESGFGSLQMVRGFLLNNELTDFSFTERDAAGALIANRVQPGKRPRSSMSPTIVFNRAGQVEMVVGSPGGSNIIQYVVKALVGVIDYNMDMQQAINLSNYGAQTTATTTLERGSLAAAAEEGLKAKGHTVALADINSGLHGIVVNGTRSAAGYIGGTTIGAFSRGPDAGKYAGGADPRREGVARGNN
jgi:gamma-glutamyltranspeptidase / glutathione hydrolase